jgi:hypothetical protein
VSRRRVVVKSVASGREADGFRGLRVRPRERIPDCAGNDERLDVRSVASGREADGFRGLRVRNPRERIPDCADKY